LKKPTVTFGSITEELEMPLSKAKPDKLMLGPKEAYCPVEIQKLTWQKSNLTQDRLTGNKIHVLVAEALDGYPIH